MLASGTDISSIYPQINSYIDYCNQNFVGLKSFEQESIDMLHLRAQLKSLLAGVIPINIFLINENESAKFHVEDLTQVQLEQNDKFLIKYNFLSFESAEIAVNNNYDCNIILKNTKEAQWVIDNLVIFRKKFVKINIYHAFQLDGYAISELLDVNFILTETVDFSSSASFRLMLESYIITPILNDYESHQRNYTHYIWSVFLSHLKAMDVTADADLMALEAKLKISALENPQGNFSSSHTNTFTPIKSTLDKYVRDTSLDYQKRLISIVEANFNPESGNLIKVLQDQIENIDTTALDITKSIHKKDIDEVRFNQNFVGPMQNRVNADQQQIFEQKLITDVHTFFEAVVKDVNKEISKVSPSLIQPSYSQLLIQRKMNGLTFDNELLCSYVSEISFVGKRGVFSKLKALREGAFQLMIFAMLIGFMNPVLEKDIRKIRGFEAQKNVVISKDSPLITGNSINYDLIQETIKVETISTTMVGQIAFSTSRMWSKMIDHSDKNVLFTNTKNDVLTSDEMNILQSSPMDLIGRGTFIGLIIASILMYFSYREHGDNYETYTSEEKEKHLRNIKNELKGSAKKVIQTMNKNMRDCIVETFNEGINDLIKSIENIKQQVEERENEHSIDKSEQSIIVKYYKVKHAELTKFKTFNKTKIDEYSKVKIA
jgi:hypothetical protein